MENFSAHLGYGGFNFLKLYLACFPCIYNKKLLKDDHTTPHYLKDYV